MTALSGPQREATSRRRFLAAAGTAAAVPAAVALIGGPLAGTARAATPGGLPDYAPIPSGALGPALNADGYFVGNINGNLLLRDDDPNRPAPTVTFDDHYVLEAGGERLLLDYHGPNHTPDNIFIYAHDHQTLMVVDVIFPGWVPFKNLAVSQDIPDWVSAQDVAMGYQWHTIVGGHLGRLGQRADGDLQIAYVADLLAGARATVASLDPAPFFAKYGNNSWAIFKAYLDAAAAEVAGPVIAKYLGKLAAADVFTADNAYVMFEALRVEYGMLGPFGDHP